MAEAIITGILEKIGSIIGGELIYPELWLVLGKGEVVEKLKDNLLTIQTVLNDAEKRQVQEDVVKLWLSKLKDAAYDVDNVLDEMETAMIKSKIEEEEKAETETTSAKVWSSCLSWIFIELNILVQRCVMAHKIKILNGRLDDIAKERVNYRFELTEGRYREVDERPPTTSFVDVSDICGRDKDRYDLVRNLLGKGNEKEKNPYVISLVGMGGIGKTTLAQLAYNDREVQAQFEGLIIWICVSNPFDEIRVAKAIIESIKGHSPNITELQNLLKNICDLIGGKKFFLVLDDVWTDDYRKWEPFRNVLQYGAQGSRILITTRKESVAKMVDSADTINLEVLSNEDCWLICSKMAFVEKDDKQLEELGRELANKCKGLPLAAKTLGSLMRDQRSKQQWKNILDSDLWEFEDVQKGLLAPLLLSYYDLSSAVKQCFLYCAAFPKDHVFSKNELVYLWMAQGYLDSKINIEMEVKGEGYFDKLVMRSLFQDFERDGNNSKIISYKMHDIVHDFAQTMSTNECFTIHSDKEVGIDSKSARHLTLTSMRIAQSHGFVNNVKKLRSLFCLQSPILEANIIQHLMCLRALTLKDGSFTKLPDEVEKLIHLRFLNLSGNLFLSELPETMCNLCNLQTLDFSGCVSVTKFPRGMSKLINLRHLIHSFGSIRHSPKGIGKLSCLRTLNEFNIGGVNDDEGCKLGELKNLNHITGYLNIDGLGNVIDVQEAENAHLENKTHLHDLNLSFGKENRSVENNELVLNALKPHLGLEILRIDYYKGTMYPNWIISLTQLKRLVLWGWDKLERLPPLGKLPVLESLEIRSANSVKKVGIEFLGIDSNNKKDILFPKLESLTFRSMKEWEEWDESDGMGGTREENKEEGGVTILPSLHSLTIQLCKKLKSLPDFLRTTPLKELNIRYSNILSRRCERETGYEWPKISHIPTILIDSSYVQVDGCLR